VAFPTETVYGLGADATNKASVAKIYQVKGRPINHPLIVHISSKKLLLDWATDVPEYAKKLALSFWPGPMTLILPRTTLAKDFVTGGQDSVGIRIPSHNCALDLLSEFESQGGLGIAAPSANRFGKVSPTTAHDVLSELGEFLNSQDKIIDGGSSRIGIESTIIDCTGGKPIVLRPGAITFEMIEELLSIRLQRINNSKSNTRAPGLLNSHYAPNAKLYRFGRPEVGDGFIALADIPTPDGAIRLASPKSHTEFAQVLYGAFRLADIKQIKKIYVIEPIGNGIAVAINDRILKAVNCDR
jgi:L-threonylcarbamoyladenylate synthase